MAASQYADLNIARSVCKAASPICPAEASQPYATRVVPESLEFATSLNSEGLLHASPASRLDAICVRVKLEPAVEFAWLPMVVATVVVSELHRARSASVMFVGWGAGAGAKVAVETVLEGLPTCACGLVSNGEIGERIIASAARAAPIHTYLSLLRDLVGWAMRARYVVLASSVGNSGVTVQLVVVFV